MRELPAKRLDPKVKIVWRICYALLVTLIGALIMACLVFLSSRFDLGNTPMTVFGVIWFLSYVFFLGIFPAIRYARWRYEIKDSYLDLMKGGVFRNRRHTIPYCRVMDIDTRQGLLLRAFKLTDVTVSTRANEHIVPGLDIETAEQLCDRINALVYQSSKDVEA